ncbi:MAG: hypothetical protein IT170_13320 [Bryobacterales bacterium]|nr:hypothetical protein [Bryobacterales bacterium]
MRACLVPILLLAILPLPRATAQSKNGCSGSTPVATFKLYAKPEGFAPYPLREVNQLEPGMKIQYQPISIPGNDPDDARVTLILAESRKGVSTQRLEILDAMPADKVAEWDVPFRTELVAMVFGPQGFSEGKVNALLKKDTSLIRQLADYAEQNQRVEDLINVLAEAERQPRPAESLDAALSGVASRYGTSMSPINRESPTSEQAMTLMRALNPALTTYDPLAPNPSQRLQQSAGLAASVAGLFWGNQVALYAGGAALFLNLRGMLFPGSEFRSALMQTGAEQRMTLCSKETERRSRTRIGYLWASRIPDSAAPGITLKQQSQLGAGLPSTVPVTLSDAKLWRFVNRTQDWKLVSTDGREEYPVEVTPDVNAGALRFTPPAGMEEGEYKLAGRWDWTALRPNGSIHVYRVPEGSVARIAASARGRLVDRAANVELELEGANFRFVEQAALVRKDDPYAKPRTVPFRMAGTAGADASHLFVLLDGEPLRRGEYRLTLKQTGGKELSVEVPVMPEPPSLSGLPLRLNRGSVKQRVVLQGTHLELIDSVETPGVAWERSTANAGEAAFDGTVSDGVKEGSRLDLRIKLKDRPEMLTVGGAVEVLGPLPVIAKSRIAYQQESGVALREGELALGSLVTALIDVRHGSPRQTLLLACANAPAQAEALSLRAGESQSDARLQASNPESLYLTFDPGRIGQNGCEVLARVRTANGESSPSTLGRVVRLPRIEAMSLSDELVGENQFAGSITGEDLEAIARVGWNASDGVPVTAVPRPRDGDSRKQQLRIALPWPAPSPRAPLFIWLYNESEGRQTTARLGSAPQPSGF